MAKDFSHSFLKTGVLLGYMGLECEQFLPSDTYRKAMCWVINFAQ